MDYLLQIRENIDNLRQLEFGLIQLLAYGMIVCGVFVFVLLRWFKAAYGRYSSSSWGFGLPSRLAWLVQELPSLLVPIYCALYMDGVQLKHIPNKIILGVFVVHYVQRYDTPCHSRGACLSYLWLKDLSMLTQGC